MSNPSLADELTLYGPDADRSAPLSVTKSRRYCRRLARRHCENFTVASRLLPNSLGQHFCNVYAYCRWADDLADESGNSQKSLVLLDWWGEQLADCYRGRTHHPVFNALAETIGQFDIPRQPFADLLVAFRQDQQVRRYESSGELIDYCRYSANPVGRLVLHLGQCHDERRGRLADAVSTGLQLANFCQDVARDWEAGRIYLPMSECRRHGCDESTFAERHSSGAFRRLLAAQVDEAEGWLRRGVPLVDMVPHQLQFSVALFIEGGLTILDAIRRQDYDVWSRRPTVSKLDKLRLAVRCWWRLRQGIFGENTS